MLRESEILLEETSGRAQAPSDASAVIPHRSLGLEVAVAAKVKLYGVRVDSLTIDEAVARREESIEQRRPIHHAFIDGEPFLSTIRGPSPGSTATSHPARAEPNVLESVSVTPVGR